MPRPLKPSHDTPVLVDDTSAVLVAALPGRLWLILQNLGPEDIHINIAGGAAVFGEGIIVRSKTNFEVTAVAGNLFDGLVNAIADVAKTSTVLVTQGVEPDNV